MNAPSAHNKRPWSFIVIRDRKTLEFIAETKKYAHMLNEANVAIAAVGSITTNHWQSDMAASTQNILLAATTLGIGSCWIGINLEHEETKIIKEKLNIPEEKYLFSLISLGYPVTHPEKNDAFDNNLIHYEKYNQK